MTRYLTLGSAGLGVYEPEEGRPVAEWRRVDAPADAVLCPGFVDLHIHGAKGIDGMTATSDEIAGLCDWLATQGYEAWLPTTVSCAAHEALAFAQRLPDHPMILGFHLEGPFLSPKYPGAQPESAIAAPPAFDDPEWGPVFRHPKLKIVTLAPERPGAAALVSALSARGVVVSMGHTNATFAEAMTGFEAGVSCATHAFNAMRGLHHREVGALGFALTEDRLFTELIYDRKHVSTEAARLLLKCKPPGKVIAVSDSSAAAGLPEGSRIDLWGHAAEVEGGAVRIAGTQTLAGSTITLLDAFRNIWSDFGLEAAIGLTSQNAQRLIPFTSSGARITFGLDMTVSLVRSVAP
ncbi:MAG: amidohydrolase family protein [Fimbriimonadaceae bacterium]|nr:amidohydrolase family protein [Fimbriimonadaceae bacterium]